MTINEAFKLVCRDGANQEIRCLLSTSRNREDDNSYMSIVNQHKHNENDNISKIYVAQHDLDIHEKNFAGNKFCELLIKKNDGNKIISVRIFCKFLFTKNKYIYIKLLEALDTKCFDNKGKEISIS